MLHRAATRRAFTLFEVLIALALMMALLYAFFQFMNGSGTAHTVAREAAARQLHARTVCDMIERDLMCCLVGDNANGAGVKGSATELRVLTRAVSAGLAVDGASDRFALIDLQAAAYVFEEGSRAVTIERSIPARERQSKPDSTTLAERTAKEDDETSARNESAPERETITPIERVRFRYFDGSTWQESFDSLSANRLPVAVEVSLWLFPLPKSPAELAAEALETESEMKDRQGVPEALREFGAGEDDEPVVDEEFGVDEEDNIPPPDVVRIVTIPDARVGGGS